MPQSTAWESKFAAIVAGFITAADPNTTGIPAAADLPRYKLDDTAEKMRPSLDIVAQQEESAHPRLLVVACFVTLRTTSPDEAGHGGTAPAAAQAIAQALRARLTDSAAWRAYLTSLSESDRTGWQILKMRLRNDPDIEIDPDSRARDEMLQLTLRIQISSH